MNLKTKAFVTITAMVGIAVIASAVWHWQSRDPVQFAAYVAIALMAAGMKVVVPGINGSMSVTFIFILLGLLELSLPETIAIGCTATLVQCFWMQRPRPVVRFLFNVCSMMAPAIWLAAFVYRHSASVVGHSMPLMLMAAGCAFFFTNTVPVAMVISLSEQTSFRKVWSECHFWSFPYYLAGAGLVALIHYVNSYAGWQTTVLVLPIVYWVYRSYRIYLGRLEDQKHHVEDIAALHLRTIEALALAIDAKDHTTHDHLQRVRVYAMEIGKELNLSEQELEALRAASLLHDIGKLAVPEHIINKPGKLTVEEFEKMKIHPIVGAEILQRVTFPYPVVPIVRSHHEKWDGRGYPDGLKGEQIPIGARILSAVDVLDALASDRQYRRALPLDQAMEEVVRESGTSFDPRVVELLKRRYIELERLAQAQAGWLDKAKLPTEASMENSSAPAAGFERSDVRSALSHGSFLNSIAAARQEAQTLFELSHELGNSLSLDATLSVFTTRLRKLVPYDSIAVYVRRDERLVAEHVSGDDFRLFSSLAIPLGEGVSGWVAKNRTPIVNGNPSVEPGYLNDSTKFSTLRSAISVPLEGVNGVVGALTLYKADADAFTRDHLRILLAISGKVGLSIENALKYRQAENSAVTDYLTGLPNARSLFLHLDAELARSRRTNTSVAVMVCDLDGFKQINDRFGHLEGNKVLRDFANALRGACRGYDYVARMGGDEFVIVAPGMNPDGAASKASYLRELAAQIGRNLCGDELLSLSVGASFFPHDGVDAEQLLAQADRRMYVVKQEHYAAGKPVNLPAFQISTPTVH